MDGMGYGVRDDNKCCECRDDKAGDGEYPHRPRPPCELTEEATEDGADDEARGSAGTKEGKDEGFAVTIGINPSEEGNAIGEDSGRANALHGANNVEEDDGGGV